MILNDNKYTLININYISGNTGICQTDFFFKLSRVYSARAHVNLDSSLTALMGDLGLNFSSFMIEKNAFTKQDTFRSHPKYALNRQKFHGSSEMLLAIFKFPRILWVCFLNSVDSTQLNLESHPHEGLWSANADIQGQWQRCKAGFMFSKTCKSLLKLNLVSVLHNS